MITPNTLVAIILDRSCCTNKITLSPIGEVDLYSTEFFRIDTGRDFCLEYVEDVLPEPDFCKLAEVYPGVEVHAWKPERSPRVVQNKLKELVEGEKGYMTEPVVYLAIGSLRNGVALVGVRAGKAELVQM